MLKNRRLEKFLLLRALRNNAITPPLRRRFALFVQDSLLDQIKASVLLKELVGDYRDMESTVARFALAKTWSGKMIRYWLQEGLREGSITARRVVVAAFQCDVESPESKILAGICTAVVCKTTDHETALATLRVFEWQSGQQLARNILRRHEEPRPATSAALEFLVPWINTTVFDDRFYGDIERLTAFPGIADRARLLCLKFDRRLQTQVAG